jgi:anhydro-N-acetylmuramic acid kinase
MIVIGLMSGTSADAIDVAVVRFERQDDTLVLELLGYRQHPYPTLVREQLRALLPPATGSTAAVCELAVLVGEAFAVAVFDAIASAGLRLDTVDLIASHGQTVYHQVAAGRTRSTLQLGAPAVIAARTGCTVVADFRPRDIAEGGQGAPLLPLLDTLLYRHPTHNRALQNIGGIANVTWVAGVDTARRAVSSPTGQAAAIPAIQAFDTGPGNCLLDELVYTLSNGQFEFDQDGAWALRGQVNAALLAEWLADPYFALPPPKSTGREYWSGAYATHMLAQARARVLSDADLLATATALTARSIADAYRRWLPALPDEVLVSGGGAHNQALMAMLAAALPGVVLNPVDICGLPGDAKEAVGFAWLGYYTLHGWPGNLPACTGAGRPAVLGSVTPGNTYHDLMRRVLAEQRGPPSRATLSS